MIVEDLAKRRKVRVRGKEIPVHVIDVPEDEHHLHFPQQFMDEWRRSVFGNLDEFVKKYGEDSLKLATLIGSPADHIFRGLQDPDKLERVLERGTDRDESSTKYYGEHEEVIYGSEDFGKAWEYAYHEGRKHHVILVYDRRKLERVSGERESFFAYRPKNSIPWHEILKAIIILRKKR